MTLGPVVQTARGRLSDLVFTSYRNQAVVRKYVVPKNPRSTEQQQNRNRFAQGLNFWSKTAVSDALRDYYGRRAAQIGRSGRQLFLTHWAQLAFGTGGWARWDPWGRPTVQATTNRAFTATSTAEGQVNVTISSGSEVTDPGWTVRRWAWVGVLRIDVGGESRDLPLTVLSQVLATSGGGSYLIVGLPAGLWSFYFSILCELDDEPEEGYPGGTEIVRHDVNVT